MSRFFGNWDTYKWHYIVILIVLAVIFATIFSVQYEELRTDGNRSSEDGNGQLYAFGRGDESEDNQVLLNRIIWASFLERRITLWTRLFIATAFAVLLIIILVYKELPPPQEIVVLFFAVFIPFYAARNFFYVHGDMYNDAYISTNAKILLDKLGLKQDQPPPEPVAGPPDRPFVTLV